MRREATMPEIGDLSNQTRRVGKVKWNPVDTFEWSDSPDVFATSNVSM